MEKQDDNVAVFGSVLRSWLLSGLGVLCTLESHWAGGKRSRQPLDPPLDTWRAETTFRLPSQAQECGGRKMGLSGHNNASAAPARHCRQANSSASQRGMSCLCLGCEMPLWIGRG